MSSPGERTPGRSDPNSSMAEFPERQHPSAGPRDQHASHRAGDSAHKQRWLAAYGPHRPDPWVQRKGGVGFLVAVTIWSAYVVIGRVCAPALQGESSQGYSIGVGAGTMVGFAILWMLFAWSYMKMILTGPGFARKYLPKVAQPVPDNASTSFIPYRPPNPEQSGSTNQNTRIDLEDPDPSELAPIGHALSEAVQLSASHQRSSSATLHLGSPDRTGDKDERTKTGKALTDVERPVPKVDRVPRWCRYCEIFKPDRAHHCRHCGTCVLQFDHHCLWIGQCVGWANHKFFIVFTFWASLFCTYILVFLALTLSRSDGVDGQIIAITVLAGFFAIFALSMLPTHVALILSGKTTVESFAGRDQTEMENSVLHREFGFMWNHNKRTVRRRWKEEFGGVNVDDRWKVGTWQSRWTTEMGDAPLGWILPIGRPKGDGLHYPSSIAFGPNGEWLKRAQWPASTPTPA